MLKPEYASFEGSASLEFRFCFFFFFFFCVPHLRTATGRQLIVQAQDASLEANEANAAATAAAKGPKSSAESGGVSLFCGKIVASGTVVERAAATAAAKGPKSSAKSGGVSSPRSGRPLASPPWSCHSGFNASPFFGKHYLSIKKHP